MSDTTDAADPASGTAATATSVTDQGATAPVTAALPKSHTELLSRIWQQSLPLMRERVASLEAVACLSATETLTPAARTGAADLAHKLAGSLGMFGYPEGTEIAREMEQMFEGAAVPDSERLQVLTRRLRAALPL